jgi:hypothetical protein
MNGLMRAWQIQLQRFGLFTVEAISDQVSEPSGKSKMCFEQPEPRRAEAC